MGKAWVMRPLRPASVTATTTAAGFDVANLLNDHSGVVWKSAGGAPAVNLNIDMGAPVALDAILLFGCTDAQSSWTVRIRSADDAAMSVNMTQHTANGPFLAGSMLPVHGRGVGYWEASAPTTPRRYWLVQLADLGNAPVTVARLALGQKVQLNRNFAFGGGWGVRDLGSVDFSDRGVRVRRRAPKLRTLGLSFPAVTREEVELRIDPLLQMVGGQEPIVLVTDPDPDELRQRRCYWGHLIGELGVIQRNANGYEWKASLVDIIPVQAGDGFAADGAIAAPAPTLPTVSISGPASVTEGNSGTTNVTYTVTRAGDFTGTSSVTVTISGTGANPASVTDFVGDAFPSGTVSFAIGESSKTFVAAVKGETAVESDEGMAATLSSPVGCTISGASTSTTITNDDATPALSLASAVSQVEGNSGTTVFVFTVNRTGSTAGSSSASWVVSGSGTNPASASDFVGGTFPSGTVSFAAGETSKTISINVAGDTAIENDETFTVTLSAPSGATIGTATAVGTITNDDSGAVTQATIVSTFNSYAGEGDVWFGDDLSTLYQDTGATQPVTTQGQSVGAWKGKVNNTLLTQHTTAPVLDANGIIKQGASSAGLQAPTPLLPTSAQSADYTQIIVGWIENGSIQRLVSQYLAGQSGRFGLYLNQIHSAHEAAYVTIPGGAMLLQNSVTDAGGRGSPDEAATFAPGYRRPFVLTLRWRNGVKQSSLRLNGRVVDTFTRPATVYQGRNTRLLGNADWTASGLAGVGFFLSKRAYMSDADVEKIELYALKQAGWNDGLDPPRHVITACRTSCTMRVSDGAIIAGQGHYAQSPPYSITKTKTALLAGRHFSGAQWNSVAATITSFEANSVGGSDMGLATGDIASLDSLAAGMAMPSGNDAAFATARLIGQKLLDQEGNPTGDPYARFYTAWDALDAEIGVERSVLPTASGWTDSSTHITTYNRPANSAQMGTPVDFCRILRRFMLERAGNPYATYWKIYQSTTVPVTRGGSTINFAVTRGTLADVYARSDVIGGKGGGASGIRTFMIGWTFQGQEYATVIMDNRSATAADRNRAMLETIDDAKSLISGSTVRTVPAAFAFTDQTNVTAGSTVVSNAIAPASLTASTIISIAGGEYSIFRSGSWTAYSSAVGTYDPATDSQVRVRHTASAAASTATDTTLTLGERVDVFTSTTAASGADTVPDAFSFAAQSGVALNTTITSAGALITGINAPAPVSVNGGLYQILRGGTWTTATATSGTFDPATDTQVRAVHTSSTANATSVNTVVTIGGVSATFTSTTVAAAQSGTVVFRSDFEGSSGDTSVVETSSIGATVTITGGASISNGAVKTGTTSLRNPSGSNGYAYAPHNAAYHLGSGAFTIETYVMFSPVTTGFHYLVAHYKTGTSAGAQREWALLWHHTTGLHLLLSADGVTGTQVAIAPPATWNRVANTWYHIRAVHDGSGTYRIFVDGQMVSKEVRTPITLFASTAPLSLMAAISSTDGRNSVFMGYLDRTQVIKGEALSTTDDPFTPPTAPF